MFDRDMKASLLAAIQYYPIVTIMGPRQAGKTTLAKQCFPDKSYVNLESPDIRRSALDDPRGFLAQYPQGAILDEIQNVPELLSYLQVLVDEQQQEGLFILTGSHQFSLKQAITQSLAGRTAVFHLLPLTFSELDITASIDVNTLMLKGFFPRVHVKNIPSYRAYQDYVQTYLERDVGNIIQLRDLAVFQKFLTLCAGRIGQIMNKNSLANEVGVSNRATSLKMLPNNSV